MMLYVEGIKWFGPGSLLAKTDIEFAFKFILALPDAYERLGKVQLW